MKRIAIIGFGGAGYSAAKEARKRDGAAKIDVYSDAHTGPANPMLTTYYVKGAIPYEALFPFGSLEQVTRELDLDFHGGKPVLGISPETKTLHFAGQSQAEYDEILISTGASAAMPPIPGLDLPGVCKMRTAEDAVQLRALLDEGKIKSGLVIGASWVGVKVVEDLVERDIPCTLVDGAKWMFYTAAFQQTAARAQAALEAKGVRVACGQMLHHIQQEPDGRLTAVMQDGGRFTADMVAVCIGVRLNTGFLQDSGIAMNRGVLVDQRMRTNYPGIYAAGDCCEAYDIQSGTQRSIGVWYNAVKQGRVAGANMAGGHMEFDANVLVNLAHYLGYDFISIGDVSACKPGDEVFEYEQGDCYVRAVRQDGAVKCINMIGTAGTSGVVKHCFIKSIENPAAELDVKSACLLLEQGFPPQFINFLGGKALD